MKKAMKEVAALMGRADPSASFVFVFWDGEHFQVGDRPKAKLVLRSPAVVRGMLRKGFHGFGEAYVSEDLAVEGDLQELLRLGLITRFDEAGYSWWQRAGFLPLHLRTRNTPRRVRDNIGYHYDRSNDFYALFLDETMTYSCAYFRKADDSLAQAQRNKYEHICRKLMLDRDESIVDIGCGWGGMLLHAALERGARGLGNTLSRNQHAYVESKIAQLGLDGRIQVGLQDFRTLSGVYDKFVSIGMLEHVGREYLAVYMEKVAGLLKKGGLGLLHTIGKEVPSPTDTWMLRYIFPGGYIPSLGEITRAMGRVGFCILDIENLRMHYAMTLDRWIANFEKNADEVRRMFDGRFVRMWRLYLNASSAGFKYGGTRLYQILFSNGLNNELPLVRDYMYR